MSLLTCALLGACQTTAPVLDSGVGGDAEADAATELPDAGPPALPDAGPPALRPPASRSGALSTEYAERIYTGEAADPFVSAVAERVASEITSSELETLLSVDWESETAAADAIRDPAFFPLLELVAAEVDRAYPADDPASPLVSQECFDYFAEADQAIKEIVVPLAATLGLRAILAGLCTAVATAAAPAIAFCAVGFSLNLLAAGIGVAEGLRTARDWVAGLRAVCPGDCGGNGEDCCVFNTCDANHACDLSIMRCRFLDCVRDDQCSPCGCTTLGDGGFCDCR